MCIQLFAIGDMQPTVACPKATALRVFDVFEAEEHTQAECIFIASAIGLYHMSWVRVNLVKCAKAVRGTNLCSPPGGGPKY